MIRIDAIPTRAGQGRTGRLFTSAVSAAALFGLSLAMLSIWLG